MQIQPDIVAGKNADTNIPAIVISVDKAGHRNQCRAFCELMGWPVTDEVLVPGSSVMDPYWRRMRASAMARKSAILNTPRRRRWRRVRIVASGSASENLASKYRNLYGADLFAVFVGSPKSQESTFDLAIASHHALKRGEVCSSKLYAGAAESVWIAGVLTRAVSLSDAQKREESTVALIGGLNKAFRIEPEKIAEQLTQVCSEEGHELVVVFSRRTSQAVESYLREALKAPNVTFVDRGDRAGFENAFARAGEFYVTPDSITMICEACFSKQPVTILNLECFNPDTSTARFVNEFVGAGYVKGIDGKGAMTPLPSLDSLKEIVTSRFGAWMGV